MTIAAEKATQLDAAYNYTPVLALVTTDLSTYTVTADDATDTITATGHDFVNGTPVTFSNNGGALPGGITAGTTYYVINAATDTFKISTEIAGAAVNITSPGSGTNTVTESEIVPLLNRYADASVVWDIMVRHEVADYQGATRASFTWGAATINVNNGRASIPQATPSIIPTTGSITFRYAVVLRGANTTPGDSTGSVAIVKDFGAVTIGLQGYTAQITPTYL